MVEPDPKEVFALHRYFLWADQMREHYYASLRARDRLDPESVVDVSFTAPYMSYWYGGLYVVVEGWQELGLVDREIDELLQASYLDLLRRYRNGSFHFQRLYIDQRFVGFVADQGSAEWISRLREAFSRWFLDYLGTHRTAQS